MFKIPKGRIVILALLLGFIVWMFLGMPACQEQPGEPVSEETASGITSPQTEAQNSDGEAETDKQTSTPELTTTPTPTPASTPEPTVTPTPTTAFTPSTTPSSTPTNTTPPEPGPRDILLGVDFGAIDQHALNAPESVENSIDSLAAYLTEPAKNELQKVRAIYRWVTDNISYNIEGYIAEDYGDVSPDSVLASGTSVCAGYSNLFEALAEAAGLQAVTIGGWGKGYTYTVGDPLADSNHAWNAVKIGEGWYLLDCTWGAGAVTEEGNYVKGFEEFFFLTPPQDFVYGHLPEDPKWELLSDRLSKHEFAEAPYMAPAFFKCDLGLGSPTKGLLRVEDEATVTIKAPDDVMLSAGLWHDEQELPKYYSSCQRKDDTYQIRAVFPKPGEYILRVFAKRRETPGDIPSALEYKIDVSKGNPDFKGFPQTGAAFSKCNLELESHKQYLIEAEKEVAVIIKAPGNVLLLTSLLQDEQELPNYYTLCQRKDDTYQIKAVFPKPGEYILRVFAKEKETPGHLPLALEYKINVSQGRPDFKGLPQTGPAFSEFNLELESHKQYLVEVEKDVMVTIKAPEDVMFLVNLLQNDKELPDYYTFCQTEEGKYQIKAVFPEPGDYTLSIWAKEKETSANPLWALDYKVEVSDGSPRTQGFPDTYSTFQQSGAHLCSPMERHLQPGTMQNFKIEVPEALEVAVIVNDQWHHLSKAGELFEGQVKVNAGDVTVFAKFPNEENFWALLRYLCE